MTAIEWTDETWNPVVGCSIISAGCTNCYAMKMAARLAAMGQPMYQGLTQPSKAGAVWTGKVGAANPKQVTEPLTWKKPRRVFVNSMSDLFHDDMPVSAIADAFGVMAVAGRVFWGGGRTMRSGTIFDKDGDPKGRPIMTFGQKFGPHEFQVLTKRSGLMFTLMTSAGFRKEVGHAAYRHAHDRIDAGWLWQQIMEREGWPLPNVWLGVSVEDQRAADERIPHLRSTPAAVRFLSCEPLLAPITLDLTGINWVIAGGESGPGKRPVDVEWIRSIRDQCKIAGVAFFGKQLDKGRRLPDDCMVREYPKCMTTTTTA